MYSWCVLPPPPGHTSEMSVKFYETTWHNIPEDCVIFILNAMKPEISISKKYVKKTLISQYFSHQEETPNIVLVSGQMVVYC
jgi:hypothetical protein